MRELLTRWRGQGRRTVHEADAKRLLALAGIVLPGPAGAGPSVVKWCHDDFPHKSDHGLVRLGVAAGDVDRVAGEMAARAPGGTALVERMVTGAVAEWIVGCRRDRTFGPIVVTGPGGVLVELLDASEIRLAPADAATAEAMLATVRGGRMLDGFRGRPAGDRAALAALIARLSALFAAHADLVEEIEINPVMVLPRGEGVVAADALIVLR
ncbi:MAG: acetate--CoA ligase family protein [Alphaproteobacteria bacterium]|nr:acetate--CoA ligase family protein [Alphaproteobacteria bacterium]